MRTFFRALFGAASDFLHHGCATLAASVAFFTLLSLLPMMFLLLNLIGFFVTNERMGYEFVVTSLQGFIPNIWPQLAEEIERVSQEKAVRWVVLFTFVWFATLVFYEVEYAMHVVFGTVGKRNPFIASLRSVGLLGLLGLLLSLSFLATQIMHELVALAPLIPGLDQYVGAANQLLFTFLLPFALLLTAVTCLYRYLPWQRPAWRHALAGGLFLALLWELAKHLFTTYVLNLSVYGRMYGSLLAMVLFLLWIYYSAALFLFSAALVHRLHILALRRSPSPAPAEGPDKAGRPAEAPGLPPITPPQPIAASGELALSEQAASPNPMLTMHNPAIQSLSGHSPSGHNPPLHNPSLLRANRDDA